MYKLIHVGNHYSVTRLSDNLGIPQDEGNRHYQQFLKDVAEQGTGIVEGETVIEPDYVALRTGEDGYAPVTEQLEMQVDGTWDAHIADVKSRFPKTITGSTSIADLPQWVKEIS